MTVRDTLFDLTAGHALVDEAEKREPAVPDQAEAWGHVESVLNEMNQGAAFEPVQVAGGPGVKGIISGAVRSALGRSTGQIGSAVGAAEREAMALSRAEIEALGGKLVAEEKAKTLVPPPGGADKYISTGTMNVERAAPGASAQTYQRMVELTGGDPAKILNMVEDAEQMGVILDHVGKAMKLSEPPRTHAEMEAAWERNPYRNLTVPKEGLLNADQLFAWRSLQASLGQQLLETVREVAAKGADAGAAMLLRQEQLTAAMMAVQSFVTGNVRDTARALSQQRAIARTLSDNDMKMMTQAIVDAAGDPAVLQRNAQTVLALIKNGKDPGTALSQGLQARTWLEASIEWFKASILTGPATHVVNVLSSALYVGYYNGLIKPTAAALGAVRTGMFGGTDRVTAAEAAYSFFGGARGVMDGLKGLVHVLKTNESKLDQFDKGTGPNSKFDMTGALETKLTDRFGVPGKRVAQAATASFRLLKAEDELFMTIAYRAELSGLAAREGVMQGLSGNALIAHIEKTLDRPPRAIHEQALTTARELTFKSTATGGIVGLAAKHANEWTAKWPILSLILPFKTTPANILVAMTENSPLAPFTHRWRERFLAGGAQRDIANAQLVVGTLATLAVLPLYEAGILTGGGPKDPEQRAALEKLGWKPYAVRVGGEIIDGQSVGGTLYTFNRLEPLAGVLASITSALDRAKYDRKEAGTVAMTLNGIIAASEHLLDSSPLSSLNTFIDIFQQDRTKQAVKLGATIAGGFVPYSSALAQVARWTSDAEGERVATAPGEFGLGGEGEMKDIGRYAWEVMKSRQPFARDSLRPGRYWDGTVKMPEGGLPAYLMPFTKVGEIKTDDPASLAMVNHGVSVSEPAPVITVYGVAINLLDFDNGKGKVFDAFLKDVGETRRTIVEKALASSAWRSSSDSEGPGGQRWDLLTRAVSMGRTEGTAKFFTKTLPALVAANPEAYSEQARRYATNPAEIIRAALKREEESTEEARFRARGTPRTGPIRVPGF